MNLNLTDHGKLPTGRLSFSVFKNGKLIETFDENNLVVDGAKQVQAKLIGGSVANNSVTQIAFGTSGTAPVGGNTLITGAYTKALDSVTYPATNQVSFNFSLGTTEANGMAIIEFGLLTAGSTLFARKVRAAALPKDTDISISGSWVISY